MSGSQRSSEKRTPIQRREVSGVLLLDKPVGLSSTQAMAAAKRLYRAEKAGHTGTLDPFATGLLPVCFGEATKFSRFLLDAKKSYRATLKLGQTSSTGDTEGVITTIGPVRVDPATVVAALVTFVGAQTQVPPMYSALKQDGVPLYKLARQGLEVAREPRQITIYAAALVSLVSDEMVIDVDVSKGTYIRVLAEDIGRTLGCGAHLTALRRTATGGFALQNGHRLDELEAHDETARDGWLLPPASLCAALPSQYLDAADSVIFCHGGWVDLPTPVADTEPETVVAVYGQATAQGGDLQRVFLGVGLATTIAGRPRLTPSRLMTYGWRNG